MSVQRRGAALFGLIVALVVLGGCTSDPVGPDASGAPPQGTTAEKPVAPEASAQDVARALTAADEVPVVGTTSGDVPVGGNEMRPVIVEVYSVEAFSDRTLVRFALSSGDGEEISLAPTSLSVEPGSWGYLEGLAVVDPDTQQRLMSYRDADGEAVMPKSVFQTCSMRPKTITAEKFPQTCIVSALGPETESVTFEIPNLPPIENVPVTRHEE